MQSATSVKAKEIPVETTPELRASAARIAAFFSHVFLFDQGQQLRTIEESGLSMAQCKTLLAVAGPGASSEPSQISDISDKLGLSMPSVSRAVDGMVRMKLITRIEDEQDRRVRRIAITSKGEKLVSELVSMRLAGLEAFVATLSAAQRRKLDAAIESLFDRGEIATAFEDLMRNGESH
jgi:DNA-binding MarR family transcriptional regulator